MFDHSPARIKEITIIRKKFIALFGALALVLGIGIVAAPATGVVPESSTSSAQAAGCAWTFRVPYRCIAYANYWHSDYGYPGIGTEPSRIVSCPPGNAGRQLTTEYTTNVTASGPAQRRRVIICNFYGGANTASAPVDSDSDSSTSTGA